MALTGFYGMNTVDPLMAVNPLPPQAYTKETLQKAYAWLLAQNSSVKDMAHDQNILVSMYLKAQRNGDAALETPSIQNFKQELKSLANLMGDLGSPQALASASAAVSVQQQPAGASSAAQQPYTGHSATPNAPKNNLSHTLEATGFDSKTMSAISEVREILNLSSDAEAIRALVSLGIKHFRKASL